MKRYDENFDLETATPEELRKAVVGLLVELEKALQEIADLKSKVKELEKKKREVGDAVFQRRTQIEAQAPRSQSGSGEL